MFIRSIAHGARATARRGGAVLFISLFQVAGAVSADAQEPAPEATARVDSLEARVQRLETLVDSLRAELVRAFELATRAAQAPEEPATREEELAALRAAAAAAAEEARTEVPAGPTADQESRTRNLQILNPEISVTGDIVGSLAAPSGAGANLAAVPREFEFSFQSALDPYSRTKIFITREEEFEIAGLEAGAEGAESTEGEEGHGGFEIEEGYMYWVGLPTGLGLKLGKFRQEIGLYNRWHNHALFEVERPLPAVAFLGEDGLIQTGISLALPSFALGPATQTAWFEVTRSSNPSLFEDGNDLAYLGHLQSFFDLSPTTFLQLGATGVYADNDADELELQSKLLGLDLYFRWSPRPLYRDLSLKAEWYFAEKETPEDEVSGNGGYLQANARLSRRLTLGLRSDYLDGFGPGPEIFQLVPSVTWWQSEWVRLRLQYNLVKPEGRATDHTLLFQTVWAVGPHKHEAY